MMRAKTLAWLGAFAGPLAWSFDLLASYVLVDDVQAAGRKLPLYLVTCAAAALVLCGAAAELSVLRAPSLAGHSVDEHEARPLRFVAAGGLALDAFFLLAIVGLAIGKLVHGAHD